MPDDPSDANVVDLWAQYDRNAKRSRGRPKQERIVHQQLGPIYAGASDNKGHRTSLSVPQDLADRMHAWQGRLRGTPFETNQGMIRHAVHMLMDAMDECEDIELDETLKVWLEVDRARALAEQEVVYQKSVDTAIESIVGALESTAAAHDMHGLHKWLAKAETFSESLTHTPQTKLNQAIEAYRLRLAGLQREF